MPGLFGITKSAICYYLSAIDYDIVSSIIDHGVSHCMNIESQYFPIMMIDNMFTSNEDKYKVCLRIVWI